MRGERLARGPTCQSFMPPYAGWQSLKHPKLDFGLLIYLSHVQWDKGST